MACQEGYPAPSACAKQAHTPDVWWRGLAALLSQCASGLVLFHLAYLTLDALVYLLAPLCFNQAAPVISYPKVQEALPAAMHGGRNYTVWGSSCGWLVFFGCVAMAWPSIGYELLSCLHQSSEALREELSLSAEQACFVCADMLSSSLTNTGLLIMANQCWDSDLMHQAGAKAVAELPQNAMCIEYTGALAKTQMRLLASVAAPVSWKPGGISFHVWVKDS
eukprot:366594-Pelagomonas_calceolata.AAC.3